MPVPINDPLLLPTLSILTEKESSTREPVGKDTAGSAKVQDISIVFGFLAISFFSVFLFSCLAACLAFHSRAEIFCVICIDYWNASYAAGPYQIPTLAQPVPAEQRHISSLPSLTHTYPRMPSLSLPSSVDNNSADNLSPLTSYPLDGSNERIARLRSELQGVRTGIQRIVSGLQDLNETTHQHDLVAETSLPSFSMSATPTERPAQRNSRPTLHTNLEASVWSTMSNSTHFPHSPTLRNPRLDPAALAPSGQDRMLRLRQRAYLESDQQHLPMTPNHTVNDATTRNTHRRPLRENPFQVIGARQDVERPDYQIPVADMYGNAWGEYRNVDAGRRAHNSGTLNVASTTENRPPMIPNPLLNPPAMQQYLPSFIPHPPSHGQQPQSGPLGLQPITTPAFNPHLGYQQRDLPNVSQPPWTAEHIRIAHNIRRQQNMTAPDRSTTHSENTSFVRRTSNVNRRTTNRTDFEGGVVARAVELPGVDMLSSRIGYPYILPSGIARDHYLAEIHTRGAGSETDSEPSLTFDTQDRPPPMDAEEMKLDMSCSICREHLVDTVVLPCGHAVMCNWCADLHVPSRKHDKSIPKDRTAKCPMCRSRIKQKVSIFRASSLILMPD